MKNRVTLILGDDRFESFREDLTSKSEYFASLFSRNFSDSLSDEYHINYDVAPETLHAFITWISDDVCSVVGDRRHIKPSLARYIGNSADFVELLQFLQLAVLFAAETLIQDLTDLVACHWLIPEKSIQVWLLAKELGLSILRDLAHAACIDRLHELPDSLLRELSEEDFVDLLGNIHTKDFVNLGLRLVLPSSQQSSVDPSVLWEAKLKEEIWGNNVQCVVGRKTTDGNEIKESVYCWDGTSFFELVELRNCSTISKKNIVGRQVVSRGFDIYLVGGEYGLGTGRFENEIWRYSIISNTWYFVTSLPVPRRHMAVTFLNQKLYIIGGVGRHRLKLATVQTYDIFTGEWTQAADVPEEFISVPQICEYFGKLTLHKSALYIYNAKEDSWATCVTKFYTQVPTEKISLKILQFRKDDMVIGSDDVVPTRIWKANFQTGKASCLGSCLTQFNNQVVNGPHLIGFLCEGDTISIEQVKIDTAFIFQTEIIYKEKHSDVKNLCGEAPIGCFNLFKRSSLHKQATMKAMQLNRCSF